MSSLAINSNCASEPGRSRISLRKEGEVAWLESPNGLGATAESQLRGEASRTKFPAILCHRSTSLRKYLRCFRLTGSNAKGGCWSDPRFLLIVDHLWLGF